MLNISGSQTLIWYEQGYKTEEFPLFISSAGYQEFLTMDYSINRPRGRCDYQLIYLYKGKALYHFTDGDEIINEGTLILYAPNEPQKYEYKAEDGVRLFWMHFTGSEVEKLFREAGLEGVRCLNLGVQEELSAILFRIIRELQEKPVMFQKCLEGCFMQLIAMAVRHSEIAYGSETAIDPDISKVIKQMHLSYRKEYDPEYYAEICGISVQSFIHKFTKNMGISPGKYLTRIRMEEAAHLLRDTTISVQEIGMAVGYDNPLYFSRVFSAWAGKSPRNYREKLANERN